MTEIGVLYALLILTAVGISAGLSAYAWRQRSVPGARPLAGSMLLVVVWIAGIGLAVSSPSPEAARLWYSAQFWAMAFMPVTFLAMVLEYVGLGNWLTRKRLAMLLAIPWTTQVAMGIHAEWIVVMRLTEASPFRILEWLPGPWYPILSVHSYLLFFAGLFLLARRALQSAGAFRKQALALICGALLPVLGSILAERRWVPAVWIALVYPVFFTLKDLVYSWALFRYGLFDLLPIARNLVVELMGDPVFVLDKHSRIVDLNPIAKTIIGCTADAAIGHPAAQILQPWWRVVELQNNLYGNMPVQLSDNGIERHFDVRVSPFVDQYSRVQGRIVILHDITLLVEGKRRLQTQFDEIQILHAKLQEQSIHDQLTGLYNRHYLQETMAREFAKAIRETAPISLAMIDVDYFKNVNDTFGHPVGDKVLKALAAQLINQSRAEDAVFRYGGEEFLVVLPNTSANTALKRAEQWRASFESSPVAVSSTAIRLTISLGVASFPRHGSTLDEILDAADRALYEAKHQGRNRAVLAGQSRPAHS